MMEDLPMVDEYTGDADMMVEYDAFDYEMQDDPTSTQEPLQEYEMDADNQADYGDAMAAETEVMVAEVPPAIDMPIVEEAIVADIPIVAEPIPLPVSFAPPPAAAPSISLPISSLLSEPSLTAPLAAAPITPATFAVTEPQAEKPPSPQPEVIVIPDVLAPPTPAPAFAPTAPQNEAFIQQAPATPPVVAAEPDSQGQQEQAETHEEAARPVPEAEDPSAHHEDATPLPPQINLYFGDQLFSLFFQPSDQADESIPILLEGQDNLYTQPIALLLASLKDQENERFPGIQDCVFGLEYQELDLCIDENCKYAMDYTLKDLCDALTACNHSTFDLTLFQITDFQYSLQQRLKAVIPEYVPTSDSASEAVTTEKAIAPEQELEASAAAANVQEDSASEPNLNLPAATGPNDIQGGPATETDDGANDEVDASADLPAQQVIAEIAEHSEDAEPSVITQVTAEPEESLEYDDDETDQLDGTGEQVPAQVEVDPATSNTDSIDAAERLQNVPEVVDDESNSTGTLESSAHGDTDHTADNQATENDNPGPNVEGQTAVAEQTHDDESDFDDDGPDDSDVVEHQDLTNTSIPYHEVDDLTQNPGADDEFDELDQEDEALVHSVDDQQTTESPDTPQQATPPPAPSTLESNGNAEDLEEYGDYDDIDGEFHDDLAPAGDEAEDQLDVIDEPLPVPDETTPPASVAARRLSSGKREREEDDLSEYDVDDLGHESDSKRPRVA